MTKKDMHPGQLSLFKEKTALGGTRNHDMYMLQKLKVINAKGKQSANYLEWNSNPQSPAYRAGDLTTSLFTKAAQWAGSKQRQVYTCKYK